MWLGGRPAWFPDEFLWVVGCTYRGMPEAARPVRNLIGCNMSFRRDVFAEVGGFRSGIGRVGKRPVGCEETELCIRSRQRRPASILLYEPKARVLHRVTAERARAAYFFSRCYSEGLSKSLVSHIVGPADGLAAEWDYTLKTLPAGAARGIADSALRRKRGGLARAGAIAAGLAVTSAGYVVGTLTRFGTSQQPRRGVGHVVRGDSANSANSAR
jgi:hypothetical protein